MIPQTCRECRMMRPALTPVPPDCPASLDGKHRWQGSANTVHHAGPLTTSALHGGSGGTGVIMPPEYAGSFAVPVPFGGEWTSLHCRDAPEDLPFVLTAGRAGQLPASRQALEARRAEARAAMLSLAGVFVTAVLAVIVFLLLGLHPAAAAGGAWLTLAFSRLLRPVRRHSP